MEKRWRDTVEDVVPRISKFSGPSYVILFDIDNTLINFATGKIILAVKNLYSYCLSKGFTIFILTARPSILYLLTKIQLSLGGVYGYKLLMAPSIYTSLSALSKYKASQRELISRKGYSILLNVGNKESDFSGGFYMNRCSP